MNDSGDTKVSVPVHVLTLAVKALSALALEGCYSECDCPWCAYRMVVADDVIDAETVEV
ncbi:hypothetical protein [Tomitella gaofuii]|uniref:hypothetical protein n=1 Tax=Tomitella gaofuii TaxID=2760083 RepID=UPI0015F9A8F8|nr:hypothetical protein [Tomitella gaofuii]